MVYGIMKHRTQILLEEWQYHSLKETARSMGISLSTLIRDWVTQNLKQKKNPKKGLLLLAGSVCDKPEVAAKHDDYL